MNVIDEVEFKAHDDLYPKVGFWDGKTNIYKLAKCG